jgi:hypothetical protein
MLLSAHGVHHILLGRQFVAAYLTWFNADQRTKDEMNFDRVQRFRDSPSGTGREQTYDVEKRTLNLCALDLSDSCIFHAFAGPWLSRQSDSSKAILSLRD